MRKLAFLLFCVLLISACSADQESSLKSDVVQANGVISTQNVVQKSGDVLSVSSLGAAGSASVNSVPTLTKPESKLTQVNTETNKSTSKAVAKNNKNVAAKVKKHTSSKSQAKSKNKKVKSVKKNKKTIYTKKHAVTKNKTATKTEAGNSRVKSEAAKMEVVPVSVNKVPHKIVSIDNKTQLSVVSAAKPYLLSDAWKDYWQDYSLASPGVSFGSPTGYGANWGDLFAGMGLISRTVTTSAADGSSVIGFGLGDADEYLGLEAVMAVISINTTDGSFGHDGNFALKLHRNLPDNFAVALGAQSIGRWGDAQTEKETFYATGTKVFMLSRNPDNPMPLFLTFGLGNGMYRSQADQSKMISNDHYGLFGSVAWHFASRAGVVADYNAEKLNLGFSIAPFNPLPISLTIGALDVTARKSSKLAWAVSAGLAYNFKNM